MVKDIFNRGISNIKKRFKEDEAIAQKAREAALKERTKQSIRIAKEKERIRGNMVIKDLKRKRSNFDGFDLSNVI